MATNVNGKSWCEVLQWLLAVGAIPSALWRILLYSKEGGTGKSSWAAKTFDQDRIERITCFAQQQPEDLLYGTVGLHDGSTVTQPGSALRALRDGKVLCLEEIGEMSADCRSVIHNLADDRELCAITIPDTGEVVRPAAGYMVVATTNDSPKDLEAKFGAPFLSRWDLILHCNRPATGIIERLDEVSAAKIPGLAKAVANRYEQLARGTSANYTPPFDVRNALRLADLSNFVEPLEAAQLIFGDSGVDLLAGLATKK